MNKVWKTIKSIFLFLLPVLILKISCRTILPAVIDCFKHEKVNVEPDMVAREYHRLLNAKSLYTEPVDTISTADEIFAFYPYTDK